MQSYITVYFIRIVCVYESTAMISGKRGQVVLTDGSDEELLSKGVYDTYTKTNLRYSQVRSINVYHNIYMHTLISQGGTARHVQRRKHQNKSLCIK
jgi:hypothetical protein